MVVACGAIDLVGGAMDAIGRTIDTVNTVDAVHTVGAVGVAIGAINTFNVCNFVGGMKTVHTVDLGCGGAVEVTVGGGAAGVGDLDVELGVVLALPLLAAELAAVAEEVEG